MGESEKPKTKKQKVIKVESKGAEERNKFGDLSERTDDFTKWWDFLERGMTIEANIQVVI